MPSASPACAETGLNQQPVATPKLPLAALLALALAGFITVLTEALPAGLLRQIGAALAVSDSLAGQLVTLYAAGSLLAAIPLTAVTRGLRRRPLLLTAIAGFAVANAVTAASGSYALTMAARFVAGVSAGLLWALIAGYAARMVPEAWKGRAIAIAMVGTPLALSIGIPLGTALGERIGWRACFASISVLALGLIGWGLAVLPDFAGQADAEREPIAGVFALPGVRPVLFTTLSLVLAHNLLYTYIAPLLGEAGMGERVDAVLLVFGFASLASIWVVGAWIDRWLRPLMLIAPLLFAVAVLALCLGRGSAMATYAAVAIWGLGFGGVATLLQTALADAAGDSADIAQSMLVTAWNIAIAGGGLFGGLLLGVYGARGFAPVLLVLLAATAAVIWRSQGFPSRRR